MPDVEAPRKLNGALCAALAAFVPLFLAALVIYPQVDIAVSGLFYRAGDGFFLDDNIVFVALHKGSIWAGWAMGIGFFLMTLISAARRKAVFSMPAKSWLFLSLALMLGPVLLANAVLKDHWGRARPHTVTEFGGTARFTPPLLMAHECRTNCSFVSGDGAFGFFLPAIAFVVSSKRRRAVFWGGMAAGAAIGLARIAMGAHFFSDVIFAAFFMLTISFWLHAWMYGIRATITHCESMIFGQRA